MIRTFFRSTFTLIRPINLLRFNPQPMRICSRFFFTSLPLLYYFQYTAATDCSTQAKKNQFRIKKQAFPQNYGKIKRTPFRKFTNILAHIVRFFHLVLIFLPVMVLYPLKNWSRTREFWIDCFVKAIERAGVVWIKAFQYLSHRRDIIGRQMADKFSHLREHAPEHPFAVTKKNFQKIYGKQIKDVFQEFDEKPIASGSVGQVYKAKYKGRKVAVKVRHPGIEKYIERDINLLFFFSRVLSVFSKAFYIPVNEQSMKRTLIQQIDFTIQKQNLLIFNEMFKNRNDIRFPVPFEKDSHSSVLVQTFAEGVPITYFEDNQHDLNSVIARLGADTFFEMLIKHNFIHADGHGGNIIVEITQKSKTFFGNIWESIKEKFIQLEERLIQNSLESETMKKVYKEGRQQLAKIRKILRQCSENVKITIIDVGMVTILDDTDRRNFITFINSVIEGNSKKCADMIFSLSKFRGERIGKSEFQQFYEDLKKMFSILDGGSLDDLPGLELFRGMLDLIGNYNLELEGNFATLFTNMIALEGMAKNIDPNINILKTAIPYFKYIERKEIQFEDFS